MKTKHFIIKLFPIIVLLVIFGGISSDAQAQLGVQRKVKRKVGQRVDRKIDNAIDGALNNIFKKKVKKAQEEAENDGSDVEVNSGGEVVLDPDGEEVSISISKDNDNTVYEVEPSTSIGSFTMEVSEFKKGKLQKNSPMNITYHVSEYQFATEMDYIEEKEGEKITTIFDRRTKKITMKTIKDGEKSAMITKMPRIKIGVSKKAVDEGQYNITETGKTKTIEGYLCKEYKIDTEDEVSHVWMADEVLVDMASMSDFVGVKDASGAMTNYNNVYKMGGFMLEAHTEIKGKNETRDVYIRNVNMGKVDQKIFSLDGYQITDMSSLFGN